MVFIQICEYCKCEYVVTKYRVGKQRFCNIDCANKGKFPEVEKRDIECERCGIFFNSRKDHGKWPKFCSVDCLRVNAIRPEPKGCAQCGNTFMAERSSHHDTSTDGRRVFCSNECRHESQKEFEEIKCEQCGDIFYPRRKQQKTCSKECQKLYYIRSMNKHYKGGKYIFKQSGETYYRFDREGYVAKYCGQHRIIAGKEIGRPLRRGEIVIKINRSPNDNRPENLFICASNSEFSHRRNGSLGWPKESNLKTYEPIQ